MEIDASVHSASSVELDVGIGLNSGVVIAGNVGAVGRLEFTVIGDAVNVASRVEAATRDTGDSLLVTERTRQLLVNSQVDLVERVGVVLKGKRETVRLYVSRVTTVGMFACCRTASALNRDRWRGRLPRRQRARHP